MVPSLARVQAGIVDEKPAGDGEGDIYNSPGLFAAMGGGFVMEGRCKGGCFGVRCL
jgi:hypothetical protein